MGTRHPHVELTDKEMRAFACVGLEMAPVERFVVNYVVANAEDPGLQYGLSLADSGERVSLLAADKDQTVICEVAYGDSDPDGTNDSISDASLVLSPDVWGTSYTHHSYAADSTGDYSPGTYVDGSAFPGPDGRYAP